jgi:transcription elongation GreA/GreB family factor
MCALRLRRRKPPARALFRKAVGDSVEIAGGDVEILAIG